jgi:hypothetical protein
MWQLPSDLPKLMVGSTIPDFPGAVAVFAAATGTSRVGITIDRLFIKNFDQHED